MASSAYFKISHNFPGSPGVKTLLFNAGSTGSIPGWGAKIPHIMAKKPKDKTEAVL